MHGRRQYAGLQAAAPALRVLQQQPVKELDLLRHPYPSVKVLQVGAASKSHVLAVVHVLTIGQAIRRGPAAEEWPLFEQAYAAARFRQRYARRQPREPASDYDHVLQGSSLPYGARIAPWQSASTSPPLTVPHASQKPQIPRPRSAPGVRCRCAPAATRFRGCLRQSCRVVSLRPHKASRRGRPQSAAILARPGSPLFARSPPWPLQNASNLLPADTLSRPRSPPARPG